MKIVLLSRCYTDGLIVLSEHTREDLIAHGWRNPIHVIPNFIDQSAYVNNPIPWEERRYILFIGRMIRDKGIFDIIEMAKALGNENFVLVGPFESKSAEKHFLVMLDGIRNIKWSGCAYGNEKVDLIKHAKLTILPSKSEVFPLTIVESFLSGVAAAVTPVGMVPEVVVDGVTGIYLKHGDPLENVAALVPWLKDGKSLMEMGLLARKKALQKYTVNAVTPLILKAFKGGDSEISPNISAQVPLNMETARKPCRQTTSPSTTDV
jgi:glycosyltransferase involved in cell wall biosynthesis